MASSLGGSHLASHSLIWNFQQVLHHGARGRATRQRYRGKYDTDSFYTIALGARKWWTWLKSEMTMIPQHTDYLKEIYMKSDCFFWELSEFTVRSSIHWPCVVASPLKITKSHWSSSYRTPVPLMEHQGMEELQIGVVLMGTTVLCEQNASSQAVAWARLGCENGAVTAVISGKHGSLSSWLVTCTSRFILSSNVQRDVYYSCHIGWVLQSMKTPFRSHHVHL